MGFGNDVGFEKAGDYDQAERDLQVSLERKDRDMHVSVSGQAGKNG